MREGIELAKKNTIFWTSVYTTADHWKGNMAPTADYRKGNMSPTADHRKGNMARRMWKWRANNLKQNVHIYFILHTASYMFGVQLCSI